MVSPYDELDSKRTVQFEKGKTSPIHSFDNHINLTKSTIISEDRSSKLRPLLPLITQQVLYPQIQHTSQLPFKFNKHLRKSNEFSISPIYLTDTQKFDLNFRQKPLIPDVNVWDSTETVDPYQ